MRIDINSNGFIVLADKLAKASRSALPVAVRQTLNDAAFDVKQRTLEVSATKNFIRRSPSFFKRFSGVNRAAGFNIDSMKAEVGMTDMNVPTARTAIKNMDIQEAGGSVKDGADYLSAARAGSYRNRVRRSQFFNKENLVKGSFRRPGTSKSNFVAAAYVAMAQKKILSINTADGRFIISVSNVRKDKNGKILITSKLLMKSRSGKPAQIRATHFSREAAEETIKQIPAFYKKEAEKQLAKYLK